MVSLASLTSEPTPVSKTPSENGIRSRLAEKRSCRLLHPLLGGRAVLKYRVAKRLLSPSLGTFEK
ncbi:hypothetical protein RISK_000345 [Rhodopirellula islandica]|uniref:Uncharacterized protein n=1 Tax=Rhodopirellula islandica TaxID=595434 RepID=A0A0J1BMJ1_RHOIS|nr:hypothetical protein RISK_000345 [Rhodopirellula islandica]